MTTDLEQITGVLDRRGVVYERGPRKVKGTASDFVYAANGAVGEITREVWVEAPGTDITVVEGSGPKNLGYPGFVTHLEFDEHGELLSWGAWE